MSGYLVDFGNIPWKRAFPGQREKAYSEGNRRIRLAELTDEYAEEDWCRKEHLGYVVEGRISIVFSDKTLVFKKGDGIFIPEGEANRHKGRIAKNEKALLVFIEKI